MVIRKCATFGSVQLEFSGEALRLFSLPDTVEGIALTERDRRRGSS